MANLFPTTLNDWAAGETIESAWADAVEEKIGIDGSADTDSLDYKVNHVALGSMVTGDLPFANLTQIAGLSVLGVTGASTADVAAITAASDHQVLRRSGSAVTFGAVNLASGNAVTGDLPFANLAQGSALSVLGVTGNATADVASIAAGSDHQVLRRSGTAVTFGAVNLAQSAAITGTLPVGNGGSGQTTYTNGQLLIGNTTGNTLAKATLTGTSNQITVTNGAGSITLSTPQNIHTAANPTFANLTLSNGLFITGGGILFDEEVDAVISVEAEDSGQAGRPISITAGLGGDSANGGPLNLTGGAAGTTTGVGGPVNITGGTGTFPGIGGTVTIAGGQAVVGGDVVLNGGNGYGLGTVFLGAAFTSRVLGAGMMLPFSTNTVTAVGATVAYFRNSNAIMDSDSGFKMNRAGAITGISLLSNYTYTSAGGGISGGRLRVYKNGSTLLTISLGTANTTAMKSGAEYGMATNTFAADDVITVGIETIGGTGYDSITCAQAFGYLKIIETA